ncbi:glycosyltransferase [Caldilinea sp.]|uniref:glycosyltransferase n=1 Tax=Caldilinea sp. TaxID=2293560 RepID=UPI002CCDAC1D|nr:glycosyltransferase [Anaerolineales bacterium]HQY91352.1 glycosyltransferase [Caldilinea sp.]HRA64536.1 glycosyltransferase [Caldilinea sp.]
MRVLYLYKDYYPVLGGVENHIRLLATGLRKLGVDTQVLVTNTAPDSVKEVIDSVPVYKTGRQLNISSAPLSLNFYPALRRLENGIDIAHAHMPYPPGELGQLLLGRSRRFVVTYHSDIVRQRVLGALYRPFLWQVLRRATLIAAATPVHVESSPFLRPHASKCRIIPYGIELQRLESTPQVISQAAAWRARFDNRPLLLFVGRLRHYKGVDVLIEAMRQIEGAHAVIVGIGQMAGIWRGQAEAAGLMDRITFVGELSDDDVVGLYHAADLFVLPSTNRAEMFGIVQLEAMACALPVICTELGTGTSYVNQHGKTGLVVPPNDPAALADAIRQLVANPAMRAAMGAAGRQRVEQEFAREVMLDRTLDFYREALEQ